MSLGSLPVVSGMRGLFSDRGQAKSREHDVVFVVVASSPTSIFQLDLLSISLRGMESPRECIDKHAPELFIGVARSADKL